MIGLIPKSAPATEQGLFYQELLHAGISIGYCCANTAFVEGLPNNSDLRGKLPVEDPIMMSDPVGILSDNLDTHVNNMPQTKRWNIHDDSYHALGR